MSPAPGGVVEATFTPAAERRSVLDRAHVGDVEGALGTVSAFDTAPRRSLRRRLATFLAILGPGLVVMLANNDAGGISVYAEAGQVHGTGLLWVLLALAPVLFINQEMVARLGAVSGAGHARLIVERFGRRWGAFALGDLLALNALTIVTDFIGLALALGFLGVSRFVAVPIAAALLIAVTAGGSFRRWERTMCVMVAISVAVVPLALLSHGAGGATSAAAQAPAGGAAPPFLLLVLALAGTTVAPWQFFFQQSNVVDKRITPRWLSYERLDTLLGSLLVVLGAVAIMLTCAWAFGGTPLAGSFGDAGTVARGLRVTVSPLAGVLFAVVLINASLLGAAAVTLSSSYAIGDYFGYRHSLHRGPRDATFFHGSFAAFVLAAAALVLLPGIPLGLITTGVQALAGVLLPSASVFLLLLCNDRDVLGPWVNPRWLNAIGVAVVGALIALSTTLIVTTVFPGADAGLVATVLFGALGAGLVGLAVAFLVRHRPGPAVAWTSSERWTWTTPPLETLPAPGSSRVRRLALLLLRTQLLIAAGLLVAKLAQLGFGA